MQFQSYLSGLHFTSFEGVNGICVIERPEILNTFYYISTYNAFNTNSKRLSSLYNQLGHKVKFEFHHIVEKRHLKNFFSSEAEIKMMYENVWPCVLIDSNVHNPISGLFSSTDPFGVLKSYRNVNAEAPDEREGAIKALMSFYSSVYTGNRIFQKIAFNVLNELY